VLSTSGRRLIELETQVQRLIEAHLALKSAMVPMTLSDICNGPHDTQYCMENLEQAFVDYASLRTDEAGGVSMKVKEQQRKDQWYNTLICFQLEMSSPTIGKIRMEELAISQEGLKGCMSSPRLSQVVLGRPFIEVSNMTHDLPEGLVRFTNESDEVAYKMPHKIEQYNSLSILEKEHTKSVYLRNEEDKRRGVEYVMSKIL
nr:retrotransposon Orf1 [Tanacetum cinerariifolium]